jgi:hypothetical protein
MAACGSVLGMVVDRSQVLRLNTVQAEETESLVLESEARI